MKKLVTTPFTNTIWWATVNEEKGLIAGNKENVTDNTIDAVFQHLIGLDGFSDKGFVGYEIPKRDSDEVATMCVFSKYTYVCIEKELYEELKEYKKKYEELVTKYILRFMGV